jgi:hypothetical protein
MRRRVKISLKQPPALPPALLAKALQPLVATENAE